MSSSIKTQIYNRIMLILEANVSEAKASIESAKESRNSDTKSSAGDKYETGRAMMQMEMEKGEMQLNKALSQLNEFSKINLEKQFKQVEFGSLVLTNNGNYFVSIGLGKMEVDKEIYFAVSLSSPIGSALHFKKVGESFDFNGNKIVILSIL